MKRGDLFGYRHVGIFRPEADPMLYPPAVSALLREQLAPTARSILARGVDEGDPISLAVQCLAACIVQLQTARMTPNELTRVLIPLLKQTSPPGQAVPDVTTDPGSKPYFDLPPSTYVPPPKPGT